MFSLAVWGWQITIIITLGLARLIDYILNKPAAIYWTCVAWIIFTIVSLSYIPLIIFQLVVIFWATVRFAPNNPGDAPTAAVVDETAKIALVATRLCEKKQTPKTVEDFRQCCDSPAEVAFLDIMVQHYELKPVDECLMGQGITLELQFPIDKCRADFWINECLIVEIDGAAYHTRKEVVARDTRRDKYIRRQGFHILRIPAKYPLYRSVATINKVRRAISIAAQDEVKKNYPEEERFFHLGAVNCGLKYKNTPSGLFKTTQETLLRNGG